MSQKLTVRSLLNQKASRRALALRIGTLVFSGVMVAVIRTPPVDGASPAEITRPNILLIVADDQGYADLGCTGLADDVRTPNLDRLAQRGSRFMQAYATSSICNASRAGLITGTYQARQGIYWYGGPGIHRAEFPTIAEVLGKSGYATGYVGKFHYGAEKSHAPSSRSFPLNHGFNFFYGFGGGRKHYLIHEAAVEELFLQVQVEQARQGSSLQQGAMWLGRRQVDQVGFSTELFGARAREFIATNQNRPFFLQLSFNAVHNFTHQLPEEYLKANGLKGFRDWDAASEDYAEWYRAGRKPNNPEGRAHYLGQLKYLDTEVGRVVDYLAQLQLDRQTLVIYIGDNGGSTPIYANNGPLRGSKYTLYEGGIRVPLIVSWPGHFEDGRVRYNVVSSMDLLPTICSVADVGKPEHLDGIDISELLSGNNESLHHETLVWDTVHETSVRHGKWKLKTAADRQHADNQMIDLELGEFLYDLDSDPGEAKDLSKDQPEVFARLKEMYQSWKMEVQATQQGNSK
jgi:arylsulfatase B